LLLDDLHTRNNFADVTHCRQRWNTTELANFHKKLEKIQENRNIYYSLQCYFAYRHITRQRDKTTLAWSWLIFTIFIYNQTTLMTTLLRSANLFWIGFCKNLVFFQILIVIAHFWFIFFNIFFQNWVPTLLASHEWILYMGKQQLRISKCIYYAFFKTAQYVSSLRCIIWEKNCLIPIYNLYAFYLQSKILIHFICNSYPYHISSYMHLHKGNPWLSV
jgi:hypothetical protein